MDFSKKNLGSIDKNLIEEHLNKFIEKFNEIVDTHKKPHIIHNEESLISIQTILDNYFSIIRIHEDDLHDFVQNKITIYGRHKITILQSSKIILASLITINNLLGFDYFDISLSEQRRKKC